MELPQELDGLCHGKPHLEMDDDWGYPYFRKPPGAEPKNRPPTNLLDLLEVFVYPNYGAMGAYRIFRKNQLVMLVNDWIYDIGISRTCHGILNGLFMADHITTTNNHLFRGRSCRHAGLLKSSHVGRK